MDKVQITLLVVSASCIAYGVGYIHGQQWLMRNYGQILSNEAIVYIAARDIGKQIFGE